MTKTTKTVFITNDKQEFGSLAEAQAHELDILSASTPPNDMLGMWIVKNKDAVLSIIGARRKPRKDKGTKRTKTDRETLPHNQAPVGVTVEASSKYRGK